MFAFIPLTTKSGSSLFVLANVSHISLLQRRLVLVQKYQSKPIIHSHFVDERTKRTDPHDADGQTSSENFISVRKQPIV